MWQFNSIIHVQVKIMIIRNCQSDPIYKQISGCCRHYLVKVIEPIQDRRGKWVKCTEWRITLCGPAELSSAGGTLLEWNYRKSPVKMSLLVNLKYQGPRQNMNDTIIPELPWATVYMHIQMTFGKEYHINNSKPLLLNSKVYVIYNDTFFSSVWKFMFVFSWVGPKENRY